MERSILTAAAVSEAKGDTELDVDAAVEDEDLYILGSWIDNSDIAETIKLD